MGRWSKRLKKYERWILLAIVILLLVSFSVAGAVQCQPGRKSEAPEYGGSFLVTPAKRGELSHDEFLSMWRRYVPFMQSVGSPSLVWQPGWFDIRPEYGDAGAWSHALAVEAAKKLGYHCGEEQLKTEIRRVVQGVMGGLEPTDATYDLFLREQYRYGVNEFQDTVREVVIKDLFLRPLIQTPRYGISYEEAYAEWKRLLQRVNLGYVSLHADEFNLEALQSERTRERIGEQLQILRDLATTGDRLLKLDKLAAEETADIPVLQDPWGNDIRREHTAELGVIFTSAGPDGEFGTADDVTRDTIAQLRTRAALRKVGTGLSRWHAALRPVIATQATLRRIESDVTAWREAHEDAWPAALSDVYPAEEEQAEPRDAWDRKFRFRVEEDRPVLVSAGPDGLFENDDDVTTASEGVASPWAADLASLTQAPWPGTLPPLTGEVPEDGWAPDSALVYESQGDGAPRLFSTGPDGEPGTSDDVHAIVGEDGTVRVPLAGVLVAFLAEEENDAWDRPIRVELADAVLEDLATWRWKAVSAGADGEFDSDDDVDRGNQGELRALHRTVAGEFTHPLTRRYEALWVHLPLVPDEALRALVEAHPDLKADDRAAFKTWRRLHKDTLYMADDPADPETGHGVDLAERLAPGGTHVLVPDASIFGETPEGLIPEDEADLQEYVDKGWRGILLREAFFTDLFERLLTRARESRQRHEDWKAKKAGHEAKPDEVEAPGEEPAVEEFDALLADTLGAVSATNADGIDWIGVYRSEKPLELAEWEANEHIGDLSLTFNTQQLTAPGALAPMVLSLHGNLTRALVRNLEYNPMRPKDFEEVYDQLWDRHIDRKSMDLAVKALEKLRRAYAEASGEAEDEAEEAAAERWERMLADWAEDLGDTKYAADETGWFIGARPPRPIEDYDALPPDEMVRQLRSSFVRQAGFPSIEAAAPSSGQMEPGTVGSTVLRDDGARGSSSAYLVRLIGSEDPPPAAFSPRDYADYLMTEIIGGPKGGRSLGAAAGETVEGTLPRLLKRYFADFPWMQRAFELETRMPVEPSTRR